MADITQYTFSLREITEILVKHQGLKDGKWVLGAEFGFNSILGGPTPETATPTVIVQLNKVVLSIAQPDTPDALNILIDASKLKS